MSLQIAKNMAGEEFISERMIYFAKALGTHTHLCLAYVRLSLRCVDVVSPESFFNGFENER